MPSLNYFKFLFIKAFKDIKTATLSLLILILEYIFKYNLILFKYIIEVIATIILFVFKIKCFTLSNNLLIIKKLKI